MRHAILAALVGAGLVLAATQAKAQHGQGDAAPVVATPAARTADLAVFRQRFLNEDKSYSAAARAEAETRLAALEQRVGAVSQAQFELELGRIVALADNGHTAFFAGPRSRRYNRVAIRLAPLGEDFYVLRTREADADLLGARLIAIGGRPAAEVRDVGRTLHGGTPAWRDRQVEYFLESPEQMQALGVLTAGGPTTYRFRLADGREVERELTLDPPGNHPAARTSRWFYAQPVEGEGNAWRAALSAERAPWALQDPDTPFRWRMAPEIDAMVIELRQNNNSENQRIGDFLNEMQREIAARNPRNFVLDLRMNGGGDLTTTRTFMQALPTRVPGRIFVLTSPFTFSAAISSAGYVKQAAPDRVTIVGEGVGDRLNFFSEGDIVTLPNSQAIILNATERHDYETGCRGFTDCHGNVRGRAAIAVPTLAPDIAAPWTIEAYLAGRDPGMEAVAAALGR